MTDPKLFIAMKAFVMHKGKVLIVRESSKYDEGTNAARYDVPGGRMKAGPRFDENLLREIKEETGLDVEIKQPFFVNEWRPVVKGKQWQIVGVFFECLAKTDVVKLSTDHDDFKWIDPKDYTKYKLIKNLHPAFAAFLAR